MTRDGAAQDVVGAAHAVAEQLRAGADEVERSGVTRGQLDLLAAAGLFGISAPREYGGSDLPLPAVREVMESLAAADTNVWFVWVQHHTPVRVLARGTNDQLRRQWLPLLASGERVAGVAYTHLRRPGPPAVAATRVDGGWQLDGTLAWLTSWGLADRFLVGAQHGDDLVWALLDLAALTGVEVSALDLAAMRATSTVSVRLDGVVASDADVVLVEPLEQWRQADAEHTADVRPAVFGVTAEALAQLRQIGQPAAADAATALDAELTRVRATAYRLADEGAARADRVAVRAVAHALSLRATAALVAAGGGRSILAGSPAQRLARTALFLLVQGQDADARAGQLAVLAGEPTAADLDRER